MRYQITACLLGVVLVAASCGGERELRSSIIVTDSAGVKIVDNGELDPGLDLLASPEPTLRIGVVEGAPEYQLFEVSDLKRLSDGGIAVSNAGSRELRIYNADGSHRATAGGSGQGPGEFGYPNALFVLGGDTIRVQDRLDRVYFTASGEFIRRETTDRAKFSALWSATGNSSEGGQWTGDGTLFAPVYHRDQRPPAPGPLFRPSMLLVRVSADLSRVDTLGEYGGILQQYIDVGGGWGAIPSVPPFSSNTSWGLGSADGTVVAGDNAAPQIDRFSPDGSRMIIRWAATAESGSAAEVEDWKERLRNAESTRGQLPQLEHAWAVMDVPETKPFYGRVAVGSDGTIWAGPVNALVQPTRLMAFSSAGRYLGTIEIAGRFTPYDSGPGWVLGLARDENDVEFVQLFALVSR